LNAHPYDVCIIGGAGHVGLPLGLAFAKAGKRVVLYDISEDNVRSVLDMKMPFKEDGAQVLLEKVVAGGNLTATTDRSIIAQSEALVMVIGTPVDEYLNPKYHEVMRAVDDIAEYITNDQLLIMRSTLFPSVTEWIARELTKRSINLDVAFCPERIAEGYALTELYTLPQIISGVTASATKRAAELFSVLASEIVELTTEEAELAKLMTNTWRYLQFAAANQFYMIATEKGLDYASMFRAMKFNYPRLAAMPGPGFAAGPCLFKDNQQLWAYAGATYLMGDAAMRINEGLPDFVVNRLKFELSIRGESLHTKTVGVLGMAFKGDNDDPRSSLSYKLRKVLLKEAGIVLCSDEFIVDPRFVPRSQLIEESDIIIVGTPHSAYRGLNLGGKTVIDMWNITEGATE
jgi:UDP-N-acetyl-D-mannosaminuronic acid dehydrogenase